MAIVSRRAAVADNGTLVCYSSKNHNCSILGLLATPTQLTSAYDEDLARATQEINAVLGRILAKRRYDKRHLSLVITHKGPLLAWTFDGIGNHDDETRVESALSLEGGPHG